MANEIKWIRMKVGMFDGNSFKKIKRAKIGGVSYRDKLTAVWFELLDLAGKSNANGYLIDNNEIPYKSYSDIATMLDREDKEIELCMQFYITEKMIEIVDDVYLLTNFMQYQNQVGLEKIREQNRERQARLRARKKQTPLLNTNEQSNDSNVTSRCTSEYSDDSAATVTKNNDVNNVMSRYRGNKIPENNAFSVTSNVTSQQNNDVEKEKEYSLLNILVNKILGAGLYTGVYDTLINEVLEALVKGCGISGAVTFGGKQYTAATFQRIADNLDGNEVGFVVNRLLSRRDVIENRELYILSLFAMKYGIEEGKQ